MDNILTLTLMHRINAGGVYTNLGILGGRSFKRGVYSRGAFIKKIEIKY